MGVLRFPIWVVRTVLTGRDSLGGFVRVDLLGVKMVAIGMSSPHSYSLYICTIDPPCTVCHNTQLDRPEVASDVISGVVIE